MKINRLINILFLFCLFSVHASPVSAKEGEAERPSTKQERNYIRAGNKLYNEKRFAEAEVQYRKALEEVPTSETAMFNLAASLIRQSGSADPNSENNPMGNASRILRQLSEEGYNIELSEKSYYNLGNISFNNQDYASSIQMYKNALRKNPDDDKARQNLRIAQKKLEEQQQNQQNQDQQQNQQDQQNQQNQQNQQQNQDQNQQDNKDQENKDQQQNPQSPQDKKDDKQQQQDQMGSMSDANAEKILKAMENEEAKTRRRVEAEKKKGNPQKKKVTNPW